MITKTVAEMHELFRAQKVPREHIAFKCPVCGTIQSLADLMAAGHMNAEEAERYLGFSCVGRWTNAGPFWKKGNKSAGKGCDWTLGGLFRLHKLEVITDKGNQMSFEPATPEEAQAHFKVSTFRRTEVAA